MDDTNELVGDIDLGADNKIMVAISTYKGKKYLDIRTYFKPDNGNEFIPTKKGVRLSEDVLEEFSNYVEKAIDLIGRV